MKGTLKAKAIRLTAAIAAGATLMSVAACGAQPGGGSAKATGANATVWTLTDSTWASVQQTFEDWNKANPDAQIKNESFANDSYKEKIRTAIGSGNAPTLVLSWGGSPVTDYWSNENIVDLTSDLDSTVKSKVLDSVAAEGYRDDKLVAVPVG